MTIQWNQQQIPSDEELDAELDMLLHMTPDFTGPATKRVLALTRVSKLEEKGNSLEDQRARIQNFVESKGWSLVHVFEDPGHSGRTSQRPGLQGLRRAIKKRQGDIILVDRIDRLHRNLYSLLKSLKFFRDYEVTFVSLRENIDFSTYWGRLVLYVLGALAEFYVSALSEEIRLSRKRTAQNGLLSGSFRFGYCKGNCSQCIEPNGPDCPNFGGPDIDASKIRVPHPVESVAVRLMFEWYASGQYSDDDIAQRLNKEIFTLDDGTEVHFRTKGRPGICEPSNFDKDAVRYILNNPIYAGFVAYYGTDKKGKKHRKPRAIYEGQHEAIVDLQLFKRVQRIRRNRYHRTTSLNNPAQIYPLTGVLFCAEKHRPLRGFSSNGGKSRYYGDRLCQYKYGERHQKNLRADEIEGRIQDFVSGMDLPRAWRKRIMAYVLYDDGTDEIVREKFALRKRLERARELYVDGDLDEHEWYRVKADCRSELEALAPEDTPVGQEAGTLLDNLPALSEAFTPEELKTLYHNIFVGIYVRDDEIKLDNDVFAIARIPTPRSALFELDPQNGIGHVAGAKLFLSQAKHLSQTRRERPGVATGICKWFCDD